MKAEVEFDVLGGNAFAKALNNLMHAGDVFEKGKQFANHERITITADAGENNMVKLDMLCEDLAKHIEEEGGYAVFVGLRRVDGKIVEPHAYFMPGVQTISMQQNDKPIGFALFKDILAQLGYIAKTDDKMVVISVD